MPRRVEGQCAVPNGIIAWSLLSVFPTRWIVCHALTPLMLAIPTRMQGWDVTLSPLEVFFFKRYGMIQISPTFVGNKLLHNIRVTNG